MRNSAPAPFDVGEAPDGQSTGLVMQVSIPRFHFHFLIVSPKFTVGATVGFTPAPLPAILNPVLSVYPSFVNVAQNRTLVLVGVDDSRSGLTKELLLNGQHWMSAVTESPLINTTEEWTIVNLVGDVHPIHLHLAGMQLIKRQAIGEEGLTMFVVVLRFFGCRFGALQARLAGSERRSTTFSNAAIGRDSLLAWLSNFGESRRSGNQ
jgi:hypothetical protein